MKVQRRKVSKKNAILQKESKDVIIHSFGSEIDEEIRSTLLGVCPVVEYGTFI